MFERDPVTAIARRPADPVRRSLDGLEQWRFMGQHYSPSDFLLIRVLVGWVFLSEGIQKFLFPDSLGGGRFAKIGIPSPQIIAPLVGAVEIVCGTLRLVVFFMGLAMLPLLVDICVALYSTKIVTFAKNGFWPTLHEARTDVSMLLGLIFLLLVGGGTWSIDARWSERQNRGPAKKLHLHRV